jgi:hypothetical protein
MELEPTVNFMLKRFTERLNQGEPLSELIPSFSLIIRYSLPLCGADQTYKKVTLKTISNFEVLVAQKYKGDVRERLWEHLDQCAVWVNNR